MAFGLSSAVRLNKENKTGLVKPRVRIAVPTQSDPTLIAITVPIKEFEASSQTDFMMDRPSTPLFIPAKVGLDASTQILDGDLFDFDKEVEPILEVLIGKTMQTSIVQVLEESELANLRKRQEEFENLRNAELVEVQRMEAAERRRTEETERRKNQELARLEMEKSVVKKIVSFRYSKFYLSGLLNDCMQTMEDHGKFSTDSDSAVEIDMVPSLVQMAVARSINMSNVALVAERVVTN